jgi:hydrogenase maturation factor HypF (carbamoyltransferase family)
MMERNEMLKKVDAMITKHCGDRVQFMSQVELAEEIVDFIGQNTIENTESVSDMIPSEVVKIASTCRDCGMKVGHRHADLTEEICQFIKKLAAK